MLTELLTELLTALLTELQALAELVPFMLIVAAVVFTVHALISAAMRYIGRLLTRAQLAAIRSDIVYHIVKYHAAATADDRDRIAGQLRALKLRYDAIVNVSGLYCETVKLTDTVKRYI